MERLRKAATSTEASSAFDLDVRERHSILTFQDPEKIAGAVRLYSGVELWNEVALHLGATAATKDLAAKALKKDISLIVQRRNKIAHEGDMQPAVPRAPWPIDRASVDFVATTIEKVVMAIEHVTA
jgi:hypothetical protein